MLFCCSLSVVVVVVWFVRSSTDNHDCVLDISILTLVHVSEWQKDRFFHNTSIMGIE